MNEKTIATIAFRDEGYASLEATLVEAAHLMERAAAQGAQLAVPPETINLLHRGTSQTPIEEFALEGWQAHTALLCEAAERARIALVLPLLVRENGRLSNRFYVLDSSGTTLGYYQKRVPAEGEQAAGFEIGATQPIVWDGLRIGGAICIDVYFPHQVFTPQIEAGADFFVIPSYTPAGLMLEANALNYGAPCILAYSPWSRIVDRDGRELAAGGYRSETLRFGYGSPMQMASINFDAVTLFADHNQEKMLEVERCYGDKVRIRFDQPNCIFTLESRSTELSVAEVMREFGLVSRRAYLAKLCRGAS